jgi:mannose-6-phosphate isomerase-like protein (cupin superfamily)
MQIRRIVSKTKTSLVFVETFPKHYHVPVHQHRNTETFLVTKGTGYMYTDDELFELREAMKVDVAPGVNHGLYTRDKPLECIVTLTGDDTKEIAVLHRALVNKETSVDQ